VVSEHDDAGVHMWMGWRAETALIAITASLRWTGRRRFRSHSVFLPVDVLESATVACNLPLRSRRFCWIAASQGSAGPVCFNAASSDAENAAVVVDSSKSRRIAAGGIHVHCGGILKK
jgi:hypothetical protein